MNHTVLCLDGSHCTSLAGRLCTTGLDCLEDTLQWLSRCSNDEGLASEAVLHVTQVTTMLSHVEEAGKATLPDQAELDTLRSNVAKQQQKVDQLSTPQPSANGEEVLSLARILKCQHVSYFTGHLYQHACSTWAVAVQDC